MDWEEVQLKDIAFYRSDKVKFTEISFESYISTENMIADKGGLVSPSSIPTSGSSSLYLKSDVLISNIRPYFKKIWFANKTGSCSNDILVFVSKVEKVCNEFLYYKLSTDEFFDYVMAGSNGVKMPRGNKKSIMDYSFLLPPLKTQKKIASILSNYDKLIENNNKRIKLLESMAEEIYKEWFVRLRFPEFEKVEIVDGVPEGWGRKKIEDICSVGRGSSPRPISNTKYFINGNIPWLKIADATASFIYIYKTKEYVNDYGASFSRKLPKDSLIIAVSGTLGFPMFLATECCIHDGWMYFVDLENDIKIYFYYSLVFLKDYFSNQSYGAAIQNINTEIVKKISILIPSKIILDEFNKIVKPNFLEIQILQQKNKNLKETRDLLLPKLIHGTLNVED